uniref:Putative FecR n=1 Tax=Rhodopseudomonas palustris (strain BisA53) TaxID=316055 RepID=Q07NA9_RHOP5
MTESDNQNMATREDEAFEWLTRLTSGEVTTGELQALALWRAQSPENEAAFVEAGKLWHSVKPAVERVARQRQGMAAPSAGANMRLGRRAMLGGALAASAGYLMVRPPLGLWSSLSELTSDYRTVTGQQRRVTTEGGATIELNTRTSIDIRLAGDTERIELIAGEAAIATAARAARSIVALAGDGRATATDAMFNMRRDGSSVCVTCVSGTVLVEQRGVPVTLRQKQQVSYTDAGLGPLLEIDPAGVTAWQQGILAFHDEPLGRVVDEVNRYWPGKIIVANASLAKRPVTARFKLDRLEDAITQIQLVFHANVTRLPGGVVVLSS